VTASISAVAARNRRSLLIAAEAIIGWTSMAASYAADRYRKRSVQSIADLCSPVKRRGGKESALAAG
jgi:hypothetical protein